MARVLLTNDDGSLYGAPADWVGRHTSASHPQRALERQLEQTVRTGQLVDSFKGATTWTQSVGSGTVTAANRELTITTGSGAASTARRDVALDMSGRFLSFEMMRDTNLSVLNVRLNTGTTSNTDGFHADETVAKIEPGVWYTYTLPLVQTALLGAATAASADDVQAIRITVTPAAGTTTTLRIRNMRTHPLATPPAVHFQFDDGRRDTYTVAYPILRDAGFTGGIAVEHNAVGNADRVSLNELRQLYSEGWSMYGHHTVRSTDLSVEQVRQHMIDAQSFLDGNGFARGSAHWVWPGGARDAARDAVALEYWRTARKVNAHHFYSAPYVYDRVDPSHVYVQRTNSAQGIKDRLDRVKAYGGAAVLVFHSIVESEVAQEDWTIAKFQEIVEYAKSIGLADTNFDQLYGSFRPYTLEP